MLALILYILVGCVPSITQIGDTVAEDTEIQVPWTECNNSIADHPCDFVLLDQNDEEFRLYEHLGKVIILDLSAMWCQPCNYAAQNLQAIQDDYADDEVLYVTVLIENVKGEDPTDIDIKYWAQVYGISAPVLRGNRDFIDSSGVNGWPIRSWPTYFFIDREMIVSSSYEGYNEFVLRSRIYGLI